MRVSKAIKLVALGCAFSAIKLPPLLANGLAVFFLMAVLVVLGSEIMNRNMNSAE